VTVRSAILFDLDGTLLDRDASVRAFAHEQHRRLHQAFQHVPAEVYVERFVALDARGAVWKDEVYRRLIDECAITGLTADDLLHDYVTRFCLSCIPFPGLHAALQQLHDAGLALGIVTNGHGELQMATIQALGLEPFCSAILISETEGLRKPDPAIFQRAVERVGSSVERAIFVGDNPVADIAGARGAGLRAIWKRDPHWPEPADADAVVDGLGDLPGVVQRLAAGFPA
jgi:FMN phosphatase YigB (HAD superfamily)